MSLSSLTRQLKRIGKKTSTPIQIHMQMEPKSEREALGDRAERASASGLSSREKYGALSLTLNVSAKRGAAKCSGSQRARFVRRGVWHWQLARRASPARSPASRRTPPSRSPLPTPDSQAPKMLIPSKRHPSPLLSLSLSLSLSLFLSLGPSPFFLPRALIRSPDYSKVARNVQDPLAIHYSKSTNDCG